MSSACIGEGALVTVLLAHYNCEPWLARAIRSILDQTLQCLTLVVIDDGSADRERVRAIVDGFHDERLIAFAASRNVGQFRLYNRLLPHIASPFLTLQDADDWSAPERLATLLHAITSQGWDVLGSYLTRTTEQGAALPPAHPPCDVNRALRWRCRGGVIFGPTTMCRTALLQQVGGYDGTTWFGADTELVYRVVFCGRVGNLPHELYHATVRPTSLTMAPDTGLSSPARRTYRKRIRRRFYRHLLRHKLARLTTEDLRAAPNNLQFDLTRWE